MRLLALFLSCVVLRAADIVGSDLLAGAVARGLDTAAGKIASDFGGTLPGRQAFVDGRAGAAVLMMRDSLPINRRAATWCILPTSMGNRCHG